MKPPPRLTPEDIDNRAGHIYQPEADDDWPVWKRVAFNVLAAAIWLALLGLMGAALWALWTHLWLVPILTLPLLVCAFISSVTHP